MNSRGRARFAASPWKAKRVPSTVWYFILILLCLSLAGLTSRLLPVGAVAPAQPIPQSADELWQEITASAEALTQTRELGLDRGRVLRLNRQALAQLLSQAPREFTEAARETQIVLPLPLPDGTLAHFRLEESPALVPELAAQYPEIKSYRGQGLDDPALAMRCDLTPQGFHALILSGGEAVNIHPVAPGDLTTYFSYSGHDLKTELQQVRCSLDEQQPSRAGEQLTAFSPEFTNGATLRTFRLAIATTQEYTNDPQLGGGTVAGAIASLNTWVNSLNVIYETELSVHLNLVTDNRLIFTAEPDGFTNGVPGTMKNEVPPKLRDVLGVNNYDVGHVLGTGGSGVAGFGVVCNNAGDNGPRKGEGASCISGPAGSGSLSVFAHELGHQFGADHSFNGTLGACNGNRSANSAWEPGSGFTLMSYAGTCNNDNTEGSQLRFHVGSLNQILNFLGSATGASCGVRTNTGNNPPNVSGGPDFTIPRNTPFTLTAVGSDPDLNDLARLTYVWEQLDAGGADFANNGSEASYTDANDPPTTTRPLFRTFAPTTSPARTFPSLTYILNNANNPPHQVNGINTAEELPRVGRTLNFRMTLRDNRAGGGGVNDDHVTLTVDGASGPFLVTAPNTGAAWTVGSRQTVNWNVGNTNAAPINCASVRILLSTDGGLTFPLVLAAATPNDGTEDINVPNGLNTTTARLKVEAVGNIFFDISDVNFTINAGAACPEITSAAPSAGTPGTNVTLTGRGFTGVTIVRFGGNVAAANFTVVSDTQLTATVPAGAVTGPLTLSKAACPEVALAAFTVCTSAPDPLQVDDGSPNDAFSAGGYYFNRLTPTNYPATLRRVAIRFAEFQQVPTGTPLTILAGANTDGDANIDNTAFQTVGAQVGALGAFVSYDLARPITINSGDFVVGYRLAPPVGGLHVLQDKAVIRNRSYTSGDGVRFGAHTTGNFLIRAEYLRGCGGGLTCPTVTGLSAANGTPGSTVTITGTNFADVTAVRFGANAVAVFTINSSTQITATVPANAATGPITLSRVDCPDAQTANFTVVPITCPAVTGINPAKAAPGSAVTITGANLTGVAVVKFANEASANFTAGSNTQITAIVPPSAGAGPITISRTGCPNVQTAAFFPCGIPLPPLQVDDGIADNAGSGAQTLYLVNRLTPANYPARLDSVQIFFAGLQNIPAGTNITVLAGANADGDANIDNTAFQMVPAQVGRLEQFTNYNLTTPLTINSGDFVIGFSLTPATNGFPILRDTTAPKGRSYSSTNGTAFALLENQVNLLIRGQYSLSCAAANNPAPTLASLDPATVVAGAPGFNLTVNGTNFINGSVVRWNGQDRQTTVVSATQLRIAVAAADIAQAGTASVTVFNPTPGGGVSNALNFTITGCPTITINPATLPDGSINVAYNQPLTATGGTAPYIFSLTTGTPVTTGFNGAGLVAIPDNNPAGVDVPVTVSGITSLITKVTVSLHITHTFDGDLTLQLIGPDGTTVNLSNNRGGGVDNYGSACLPENQRTLFDDAAATAIGAGTAPFVGSFRPEQVLSAFNGKTGAAVNGAWRLRVVDGVAQDTGSIQCVSIFITQTLPAPGLSLATNGTLSGTPTTAGTFNFTVRATDANQCTGDRTYALTIIATAACPTVANINPTTGAVGAAVTITGTNFTGVTVVKFANNVTATSTVVNATTITTTVPAGAVTGPITISKTGCADVKTATFTVGGGCPTITVNPATLPNGNVNGAYNQALSATGGTGPYTFSLAAGNPVTTRFNATGPVAIPDNNPTGADLNVAVSGITSPITKVTVSLHITHTFVRDLKLQLIGPDSTTVDLAVNRGPNAATTGYGTACAPDSSRTAFDDAAATLIANGAPPFVGTFKPDQVLSAFNGKTGAAVNGAWRLRVVDGANEDTGSIQCASIFITQTLPAPGLSLATNGTLSGTPTTAGTFNFTARATDANQCMGDRTYALTIIATVACPTVANINPTTGAIGAAVTITGTNFTGVTGVKFANNVTATFTVVNATTITTTVPAGAVTGPITISKTGCADVQTATFTVGGGCPTITINPATLPAGTVNTAYNQTLTGSGGAAPYVFSLTAGTNSETRFNGAGPVAIPDNNPAGADLNVAVSGITSPITKVTVSLHITHTFVRDLKLQLIGPDSTTVDLAVNRGPNAATTGYGTACAPDSSRTAFDDAAATLIANGAPPFVGTFKPDQVLSAFNGKTGAAVNGAWRLRVVDGANEDIGSIQCVSIFITQTLPAPGLSLATNGTLSGTPTTAGTFNFTARATDANQCTSTRAYTLTIGTGNFGQRIVEQNGTFVADFRADSSANNEEIVVTPTSNPALRVGTYFIAVVNWGAGAANFNVTATVTNNALDEANMNEPRISAVIHEQMAAWLFTFKKIFSRVDTFSFRFRMT